MWNSPTRYRVEKWFWYIQLPIATILFFFQRDLWEIIAVFYIALLSIWALGSTADGNEESSRAKEGTLRE